MTAKQLEQLEVKLAKMGYTKYQGRIPIRREDYHWAQGFDYYPCSGGTTPRYQVFFCIYDWRKYGDRATGGFKRNQIGVQIVIIMGNWYEGRADLELTEDRNVERIEKVAKSYYDWVRENLITKDDEQ
ncbi:MAG: hypothetical protein IJ647_10255 [Prevotella sp.]|nr:hypothetical protein [Prevotella sp.]